MPGSQVGLTDRVARYDVTADSWQPGPELPVPRHHGFLVSIGGELLLFGGFIAANGGGWSASRDVLRLEDDGWSMIATTPEPQTGDA